MKAWVEHNRHSLGLALKRMADAPFAALFSILVIGIALSLPAGLYALLTNADRLAGNLPTQPEITLFLKTDFDSAKGRALVDDIAQTPHVAKARFISRDEGLKRLQGEGLADLATGLDSNPLPDAITVTTATTDVQAMQQLADRFGKLTGVDHVITDGDWVRRLNALLGFGRDLVWLLATALGVALAAITGNTIRLQIYAARDEIEVSRLIGATHRFIRRPFLYFGLLQGLLGGLAGWLIVSGELYALQGSLETLGSAWNRQLTLIGLAPTDVAILLGSASLLGFVGAFLAVGHSLRRIDRLR